MKPHAIKGTSSNRTRRGNTIVLVTAILVLLVIIATAFVGRTRAVRQISAAQQSSAGRDGRAESIARNVAAEIGEALFAKPVDTSDPFARTDNSVTPPVGVASSSWPRLAPALDAPRYSIDRDVLPVAGATNPVAGDGVPDFPYNIAPFETKAWTNWPDQFGGASPWPFGAGAPGGTLVDANGNAIGDGNPYGNPGMGDSRWLRSTEPVRVGVDQNADGISDLFTFSHWQHLSWLPSANNGWRVVADISDIGANVVDNMNEASAPPYAVAWPYEQWLPGVVPNPIANTADFISRRNQWFFDYPSVYANPALALPNFFRLRDLGRPTDEFKPDTARNVISRTFADSDGDGFTDSFWFLAPVGADRGVRTLVGVSVVDNSALLNANVATKFSFGYGADPSIGLNNPIDGTAGHTPADLALVTSNAEFEPFFDERNTVGFFDGPINQSATNPTGGTFPTYWTGTPQVALPNSQIRFDRERFGDRVNQLGNPINAPMSFLQAIGMRTANGLTDGGVPLAGLSLRDTTLPAPLQGSFESQRERLSYFKIAGLDPEKPAFGLTPFDAADEYELRALHGNNLPFSLSRFEQAVSYYSPSLQGVAAGDFQFLRASPMREESSEYLDQLDARQLLLDNRRKLTMFNGARNETMPPALWPSPYYEETFNYLNPRGTVPAPTSPDWAPFQQANRAEFERQKLKIDLRRPMFVGANGAPQITRNPFRGLQWRRDLARVLENSLARAIDANGDGVLDTWKSYFGTREADYNRTLSMIASFTANLDTASDEPVTLGTSGVALDLPLYPNQPIIDPSGYFPPQTDASPDPFDADRFYIGMEKQPFIMEVFVGVVWPKSDFNEAEWVSAGGQAPPAGQEELPPDVDDGGENFVDRTSSPTLIAAVQIANPYDTPISLGDIRLRFYGQNFNFTAAAIAAGSPPLSELVLPPATLGRPSTAIVYAVSGGAVGSYPAGAFRAAVLDFFDLERGEMQGTTFQPNTDTDGDGIIEHAALHDTRGVEPDVDEQDRTLVFDATGSWNVNLSGTFGPYTNNSQQPVEIVRNILPPAGVGGGPKAIVVDRFDNDISGPEVRFNEAANRLFTDPQFLPPEKAYNWDINPARRYVAGIRIRDDDFYMTWCRASRIWAFDLDTWDDPSVPLDQKRISAVERSPRYVFSMATEPVRATRALEGVDTGGARLTGAGAYKGDTFKVGQDPDGDASGAGRWANLAWVDMFGRTLRSKPVFFTNLTVIPAGGDEVISATSPTEPMPFLPALGLPDAAADIYFQDCHGAVEYNGTTYEWMIGNKGASAADWNRFKDVAVATIPFQMTQKDGDFEQIGEVLDVFLWGHVLENWATPSTFRTFSEIMLIEDEDDQFYPGSGVYTNRLEIRAPQEIDADDPGTVVLGPRFEPTATTVPPTPIAGFAAWQPALPAGIGFLDALTIDGSGRNSFDRNGNSSYDTIAGNPGIANTDEALAEERRFRLSHGYLGRKTSGLINLNTALPEVMQALPMATRLPRVNGITPYSRFADAVRLYRDHQVPGAPFGIPLAAVPNYRDRGLTPTQLSSTAPTFYAGMRNEQGFSSIGELLLLQRIPPDTIAPHLRAAYSARWMGFDPYADLAGNFSGFDIGYSWSTDRTNPRPRQLPADVLFGIGGNTNVPTKQHEEPLGDAEDLNLLFKGVSNLVTTRSDVFTVYLRVRQVRQNPVNGRWDAMNPDLIVDESRYVLCVDRSEVNSPSDEPRIVYFQRVPN
ncbi:MAG: hypothetical protein GC172_04880 [Phycisphaera sp.]|nr:hypothetical protein [Phycisphaera sp.]